MKKKVAKQVQEKKKVSFAEGLRQIAGDNLIGKLSEAEKAHFERVRSAQEQAKKISFVLGEQINRS